jgi:Na+-transporting NADH:ubiquinone oxidoreductase subunit A
MFYQQIMQEIITLKKGLNIPLAGEASKEVIPVMPSVYGLKPTDFSGVFPKMLVKEGDKVKAGQAVFYNKHNERITFVSPVSGRVSELVRGPKRILLEVRIEADDSNHAIEFPLLKPEQASREDLLERMLTAGLWPYLRQRPYNVIPDPDIIPRDIFISAFDSAPLSPDMDFVVAGEGKNFQTGIEVLRKLTIGEVHLSTHADTTKSDVFLKAEGVAQHVFRGPHPAGNVGVQIHHIAPVNKGEVVWVINPVGVIIIGRLFNEGVYDSSRLVALTGSEAKSTRYYKMPGSGSIEPLIKDNLKSENTRFISGNPLTGERMYKTGFLGFYDNQITLLPEGNKHDFLGWALPGLDKFSLSKTYFSWLSPRKKYSIDTNLHGGERAFVLSGQYEKVLPMDILPVQLLKSIMIDDIEMMEKLGIYEVVEEDLALCEFVCTSKIEVQSILRKGLDLMQKEMS